MITLLIATVAAGASLFFLVVYPDDTRDDLLPIALRNLYMSQQEFESNATQDLGVRTYAPVPHLTGRMPEGSWTRGMRPVTWSADIDVEETDEVVVYYRIRDHDTADLPRDLPIDEEGWTADSAAIDATWLDGGEPLLIDAWRAYARTRSGETILFISERSGGDVRRIDRRLSWPPRWNSFETPE